MCRPTKQAGPANADAGVTPMDGTAAWPGLAHGEVHLWWVALDVDDATRNCLGRVLHPLERRRSERLRVALHRDRWLTSRAVLRLLLARYVSVPDAAALSFRLGPKGKPRLEERLGLQPVHFNYSDTGGMGLYGFCRSELGVDLESLDRKLAFERIVARRFTSAEGRTLGAVDEEDRRQAFLRCWTRKEAYGKARGLGIHYPLDSVEVCRDMGDGPQYIAPSGQAMDDPRGWRLYPVPAHRGFTASVVVVDGAWTLRQYAWTGDIAALAAGGRS